MHLISSEKACHKESDLRLIFTYMRKTIGADQLSYHAGWSTPSLLFFFTAWIV